MQRSNRRAGLRSDPRGLKTKVRYSHRLAFEIAIDRCFPGLGEAPPLPIEEDGPKKTEKEEMQDFLDDLLS
jgi:hypothetical protein